jgi:hypothetical protein
LDSSTFKVLVIRNYSMSSVIQSGRRSGLDSSLLLSSGFEIRMDLSGGGEKGVIADKEDLTER